MEKVREGTNVQAATTPASSGNLIETDPYEFVGESLKEDVNTISKRLDLAPLPKTSDANVFEFRLWTNLGGLGDAKLLRIRTERDQYRATFFNVHRGLDPTDFKKADLIAPRSGWSKVLSDTRNLLSAPKGLVRDPHFDLCRDEPVILLEVFDKGEYRRVFYGNNTSFPDGKRLIEVCNYLTTEFDVNMECAGKT